MEKSGFQFSNPIFKEIGLKTNENFDEESFNGINIETSTEIKKFNDEKKAMVTLHIKIGEEKSEYPFCINCRVCSEFVWESDMDKIDDYLDINAPALLLSYSRPYISMLTASTEYPAFNIPFMSFSDNKESK